MRLQRLLNTLGEKLFDFANIAAGALIVGKVLDPTKVPDIALVVGGIILVIFYVVGSFLIYFGGD